MSHFIKIALQQKTTYRIYTGYNLWDELIDFFAAHYPDHKLFIAIDAKVDGLHGERIKKECERYFKSCHIIQIPEGEKSKSREEWYRLQNELLANGVERSTPLLAVGGGVTGDLAGFAASSVHRGIPLIHMPTSLLAMVDSSIGGKTGINHRSGKNLIGAFYQPDAVFTDIEFLNTLERREWIGGLAEMLKYAAIRSPVMFDALEEAVGGEFSPSDQWLELIRKSVEIKADIVQQDVHEAGKRAFLNFGHTFGHSLEKYAGYGNISHGEAVFIGMLAATHYSERLGAPVDKARFSPFIPLYEVSIPSNDHIPQLIEAMKSDKKVEQESIRLILLEEWGTPYIQKDEDPALLQAAWETAFGTLR